MGGGSVEELQHLEACWGEPLELRDPMLREALEAAIRRTGAGDYVRFEPETWDTLCRRSRRLRNSAERRRARRRASGRECSAMFGAGAGEVPDIRRYDFFNPRPQRSRPLPWG